MKSFNQFKFKQEGFFALYSAVIFSAILLFISISLGFSGFYLRKHQLQNELKETSFFMAESCLNVARLKIIENSNYSGDENIQAGDIDCRIFSIEAKVQIKKVKTQAIFESQYTNLEADIDRNTGQILHFKEQAAH